MGLGLGLSLGIGFRFGFRVWVQGLGSGFGFRIWIRVFNCCRERGREIEKKGEVEEKENDLGPRRRARAWIIKAGFTMEKQKGRS